MWISVVVRLIILIWILIIAYLRPKEGSVDVYHFNFIKIHLLQPTSRQMTPPRCPLSKKPSKKLFKLD